MGDCFEDIIYIASRVLLFGVFVVGVLYFTLPALGPTEAICKGKVHHGECFENIPKR